MFFKRAFDLVVAGGIGLALLGLPMLAIAAWIRADSPGPMFFRQSASAAMAGCPHPPISDDGGRRRGEGPAADRRRRRARHARGRLAARAPADELPAVPRRALRAT